MNYYATNSYPRVTFIIPVLNEEEILPRCLNAIRTQNYPQQKVEIIVADGGSSDKSISFAKSYKAKIIQNRLILHEHGKSLAAKQASGKILFFVDADNVLSDKNWLKHMIKPFQDNPKIMGLLPQTIPAPDSNGLDRYMGYLFTDPFTWFVYGFRANPRDYYHVFDKLNQTDDYIIYNFTAVNFPLFGLSQGVGTSNLFKRGQTEEADDLLAGYKLIREGGLIAYIPTAGIYHYHVTGLSNFINKYTWRVRNNWNQEIKGMGIINRTKYFSSDRKLRMAIFVPYGCSIIFPFLDAIRLSLSNKNIIMFWHIPASFVMAMIILFETAKHFLHINTRLGKYE
jgi:glycosyltransferase involved in cell wall biosynthesis